MINNETLQPIKENQDSKKTLKKMIITSEGEEISEQEFEKRKSNSEYCGECGAKITKNDLRDRCGSCSSKYGNDYYGGPKYSGMSGMPGG